MAEDRREELLTELRSEFGDSINIETVSELANALIIINGLTENKIRNSLPRKENGDKPSGSDVIKKAKYDSSGNEIKPSLTVDELVNRFQAPQELIAEVISKFINSKFDS